MNDCVLGAVTHIYPTRFYNDQISFKGGYIYAEFTHLLPGQ